MTIGFVLALVALALASVAAATRRRNPAWAHLAWPSLLAVYRGAVAPHGIDTRMVAANPDDLLLVVGIMILAATIFVRFGLPESVEARLRLGPAFPQWRFDRQLAAYRRPFVTAVLHGWIEDGDDVDVRWRRWMTVPAPTASWTRLADRLAQSDAEWAELLAAGGSIDAWVAWGDEYDGLLAEWGRLRAPLTAGIAAGARSSKRGAWLGTVIVGICFIVAALHIPGAMFTAPPVGRAPYIPEPPPGRTAYLASIGGFPDAELAALVSFYEYRYDQPVIVLPPTSIPDGLVDKGRGQAAAEDVIALIRESYPEAADPNAVVIGILPVDIYIRGRTDWGWAFGLRADDHLAVVSTARMQTVLGSFGDRLEASRLRKMITKDFGLLLWGLPSSSHPRSVMYKDILGVSDLDAMAEDF